MNSAPKPWEPSVPGVKPKTHTPGPWQFTDKPSDACCWSFHVETVERNSDQQNEMGLRAYAKTDIADISKEADARLIAAAPELLEALKGLRNVVHDFLTHKEQETVATYIKAADAAIAKSSTDSLPQS